MSQNLIISQMKKLVEMRKNERRLAQSEVFEAHQSEQRAGKLVSQAETDRDQALFNWEACRQSDHIDLSLEPMMAKQLIEHESNLQQSTQLLILAKDRLDKKQSQWKLSDLQLKAAEKVEKVEARKMTRKIDERRLADVTDRFCFGSVENDR